MTKEKKPPINWDDVIADYASGMIITDIARKYNKPHQMFYKAKKRDGWDDILKAKGNKYQKELVERKEQMQRDEAHTDSLMRLELDDMQLTKLSNMLAAISNGMSVERAKEYALIPKATFNSWMKDEPRLADTISAVAREWENHHLKNIMKHSARDWKASQWLLQHTKLTKEDYTSSEQSSGGVTVVLKFERGDILDTEGRVIDAKFEEVKQDK